VLGIPSHAGVTIQQKSIAQSAVGNVDGEWTTVIAAAVFAD
jgi:hypothetical protein